MPEKESIAALTPERSLRERCGIVGLSFPSASRELQVRIGLKSLMALWHRGQQGGGLTIKDEKGLRTHHGTGGPEQALPQSIIDDFSKGGILSWLIGQTRYGSIGSWDKSNLQPMTAYSTNKEPVTVGHNGQFTAIEKMKEAVGEYIPDDASDTYVFTRLLAKAEGPSWDEKIPSTLQKVSGAYSLVIGAGDSLYLARDPQGIRPLMLGKIGDGFIAVSETHALDKVGATLIRQIKRGEIVKINKEGVKVIQEGLEGDDNFCDFEWDYFSRPDSLYPLSSKDSESPEKWKNVYEFREECGATLAEETRIRIPNISFAIGIPDSGVPGGIGFAKALGIPYRQLILRDHYDPNGEGRLFQTDFDMSGIVEKTLGKLSLIKSLKIWKGKIVALVEDSIVRGNTAKAITKKVFEAGAAEAHWFSTLPQVPHPCHLGVSLRTYKELLAHRNNGNPEKIAEEIGATSVNFLSHKGFIRARLKAGQDLFVPTNEKEIFLANGGCGGCLTGLYPVSPEGVIYERKQRAIPISV